jgi:hypothetical protein
MANMQDIQFYAGEDIVIGGVLNPVVDITSWTLQFAVRAQLSQLPVAIIKTTTGGGIIIVSGPASTFNIILNSTDTANLVPGAYFYDVQRIDVGHHRELVLGKLTLLQPTSSITPP